MLLCRRDMGAMLSRTILVLAVICTPLLFAPRSESAIPAPPIPYASSQPLSPNGFLITEQIYNQDWTSGTSYLITILNGTSGSFDLEIKPSDPCKSGCRGWEFPLNIELRLSFRPIDDLVITDWGGKHRQLSGVSAPPGGYSSVVEDVSVTISPNPIVLRLGDAVKVKVTITAKTSATHGLYEVRLATRIDGASISGGLLFLKTGNVEVGLDTRYENVLGLLKGYLPEQVRNLEAQYPNFRGSGRFTNSSWFVLESNATLKASYDGKTVQRGWWEIKGDEIMFMLQDGTFVGRKGRYSDIVLYDGSVWRWSSLTGGFPPVVTVEAWRYNEPFLSEGFCSVKSGWVNNYPNVTTYTLKKGTSASLKFTAMPTRNFTFPLNLNLSLRHLILENGTIILDDIKGVPASFSPNPLRLPEGARQNVTVTFTARDNAIEGLYGIEFDSRDSPLTSQGRVKPLWEGHKPVGRGHAVSFFLKITSNCPDTIEQVVIEDRSADVLMVLVVVGITGAILLILLSKKRK